ncbi:caspase family protein [Streptomyces sp. NPDC048330]|uniref:caspase family protein n=1 Tax=Streptomyces sp. NPDC048330 TaxID=3365533 RepID=UPI00371E00A6
MDGAGGAHGTTHETAGIDRRLVVVGTGSYRHAAELPLMPEELRAAIRLFGGLGYRVDERITDEGIAATRDRILDWAYRTDGPGSAVVVYWTGHGVQSAGRHYLLCADSRPDRLAGTALAAEDLTRYVLESGAERVLLVIDTCGAGQGGADAAAAAERLRAALRQGAADSGRTDGRRLTDFAVIAVARAGEPASPMVFAAALETALARLSVSLKQRYLSVEQVVDTVNDVYRSAGVRQTARAHVESEGYAFFSFENTGYHPEARHDEGDVAELAARLGRTGPEGLRRRADLETHFAPRGQGFEHTTPGRGGSYFVGRTAELDRIARWLAQGDPTGERGLIVTGGPGVGKSALLGKLLLRSAGRTADTPVPTAVHARHRFLDDLVAAVADAAGIEATTPQALLGALVGRRAPLHLIIDALDEAGEAHGDDTEARRIAADLLCPLLRVPCVRLLVGARPHVLDAFGGEPAVLDLDDARESSADDVAAYARRLLQAPDGPGSRGPYDDEAAGPVAREIAARAHGSFLSARIAARHLGRAARPVDTSAPGWHARVPEVGETPGVTFLRVLRHQLGADHARGLPLLAALALAEGPGLPPDRVWRAIAGACRAEPTGPAFAWEDIAWLLGAVGEHLVEELDADGRSVYRLYHQAYADALRATLDPDARGRVAHALAALVPTGPYGPDWAAAPPYVRRHLTEHAEGTELLDALALDPAHLLTAPVSALQRVLNRAATEPARAAARAVGRCAALLRTSTEPATRAAQLRLSAFQSGAGELAEAVRLRYPRLRWDTEWAQVTPVPYTTLGTFENGVRGAAVVSRHGRPALVVAEHEGPVRAWDTEGGELLAELPADLGRITSVRGCATRPWAALRTDDRIWVWDVETRDLIGAVPAPRRTVDCAVTELDGECLIAALDLRGRVTLVTASGDARPLSLRAARRPLFLRRPFDGDRLALTRHDGRIRVAAIRVHRWTNRFRRARLSVWDLGGPSAGTLTVERKVHRSLRGTDVRALVLHRDTVHVATDCVLWASTTGTRAVRGADGLRIVEWAGHPYGEALLLTAGPGSGEGGAAPMTCLAATAYDVSARTADGTVVGRTRTDAPVSRLLPAGQGPDGLRLVSLGADARSAKGWRLGPPPEPGESVDDPARTVRTGTHAGRSVVVVQDAEGTALLDGANGAVRDRRAGRGDGDPVADSHPGAPVVLRDRLDTKRIRRRQRIRAWLWSDGPPVVFPPTRGLLTACPVPGPGDPRVVACFSHYDAGRHFLALLTPDGPVGARLDVDLHGVHSLRLVRDGARVFAVVVGRRRDDSLSEEPPPPVPLLTVRSLPDDTVRFTMRLTSVHVVHDLGRWPQGPALGYLTDDGDLAVRTAFPASFRAEPTKPDIVPRPDRVRVTALRLQTRNGRPTVLTAGADGVLTLFAADTTEVLHRIHVGGEILGMDWIDDERLCVHTATGVLCLRLA